MLPCFPSLLLGFALCAAPPPSQDFDHDGVPDVEDDCPTDSGSKANHGCPGETKPTPPPEPVESAEPRVVANNDRLELKDRILFKTGRASVADESLPIVHEIARAILKLAPDKKVFVDGHTDNRGARKKNVALSLSRAQAVVAHLVHAGVPPERLEARGMGPDHPLVANTTEDGRARNRRVEFIIAPLTP